MDIELLNKLKSEHGRVLVEFYATWCPHCRRMMPIVDEVEARAKGKATVYRFDIDKNKELADQFKVESLPTFIVFVAGEPVWRAMGEMPESDLYHGLMYPDRPDNDEGALLF